MNPNASPQSLPLSQEETDALNRHGVFFKKRIVQMLSRIPKVSIVAEELGVSFCETRVIDIVAAEQRWNPELFFVFECKRAHASDRKWIFFHDYNQRCRMLRLHGGLTGNSSVFAPWWQTAPPICSEGYEFRKKDSKADQDPIFQAAAQLSAGYLGLIARRHKEIQRPQTSPSDIIERYVPVLVTNAELVVADEDWNAISLETGNISTAPSGSSVDMLILKHPFPTPEGMDHDFRDEQNPFPAREDWSQLHKESIFVVRATALEGFVQGGYRNYLRDSGCGAT